jgi:dienelactone hydrolase
MRIGLRRLSPRWRRAARAAALLFALLLALAVYEAVVGVPLPKPAGPYPVGKRSLHLVDRSRKDRFSDNPNDPRELMVTLFYPARPAPGAQPAAYAEGGLAAALAGKFHLPACACRLVRSHSFAAPPVAEGERAFPVLIFSPGFGTPPVFYTSNLEDIASRGYVIAAISHTYSVDPTVFPDGRVVRSNRAGTLFLLERGTPGISAATVERDRDVIGAEWAADASFTLDELGRLNAEDPILRGRLDLSRAGIFGHSFGGATAAECLRLDRRFKAGANMDGGLHAHTYRARLRRPFLWLEADTSAPTDAELAQDGMTRQQYDVALAVVDMQTDEFCEGLAPGIRVTLRGFRHMTFAGDAAMLARRLPFGLGSGAVGTVDGERAVQLTDAYVTAFFDRRLRGKPAPILDGPSAAYPEAAVRRYPRPFSK